MRGNAQVEAVMARKVGEQQVLMAVIHTRALLREALQDVENRASRALNVLRQGGSMHADTVGVIQGSGLRADLLAQRLTTLEERLAGIRITAEYEAYAEEEEEVARG